MKKSWLNIAADSDFSLHNIPFGIFSLSAEGQRRVATRIGDWVIDLSVLQSFGVYETLIPQLPIEEILLSNVLNPLMAEGNAFVAQLRALLIEAFSEEDPFHLQAYQEHFVHDSAGTILYLPFQVCDYTDI